MVNARQRMIGWDQEQPEAPLPFTGQGRASYYSHNVAGRILVRRNERVQPCFSVAGR